MNIFRVSLLNGVAVIVKVASSLILNKILAIYVGPAGYAIIGQFQNAVSILISLAGGIVANGITKTTAEHFDDELKQHEIWQTAIRFCLVSSLVAGVSLIFFGSILSEWLLHRSDMSNVFVLLALFLPAIVVNNSLVAIINGKKEVGLLVASNISGSILNIVLTGMLVLKFGLYGALVAYTINPAVALISTGVLVYRRHWFKAKFLWGNFNKTALQELSGFGLMGLTSSLTIPFSYMFIRDDLVRNLGLASAGYWQAIWGISSIYLMLVTSTLSVYYLPRLAEIRRPEELKSEIIKVYQIVMPVVIIGAVSIYVLRDFIIQYLFTPDFLQMRELFLWQLLGDIIKIGSWIIGYILLGRAMVKVFVITEVIFSVSFVLLSSFLIRSLGLVGVSISYSVIYAIHWIFMVYFIKLELEKMENHNDIA